MKNLILILTLALSLTACKGGGGEAETTAAPGDERRIVNPGVDEDNADEETVTPESVDVTLYSVTRTIAPSSSNPHLTFTATATCLEFDNRQYCFDDGMHQTVGGPITYNDNYFGLQPHVSTGSPQSCKLSCNDSYMASVRDVTDRRNLSLVVLGGTLGQEVDYILATGTPTLTSCVLDDGTLTCGTLVIEVE